MMPARRLFAPVMALLLLAPAMSVADDPPPLADYFRAETARIAANPFQGIDSAEAWKAARPQLQKRLYHMMGLDPLPERTPLHVENRGTLEQPDFLVDRLLFQSSPGLYVTANLYRPKKVEGRLPAIVYVCGHAKIEENGMILGNKSHYQHHAAWFAANGYICLVLDTLQLGEVPGLHHGLHRENMWWWQSRGYTPAGLEAWNGIRAIDYLTSRPDVDPDKIGVTGRSGGGATSWWLAALDDRIAAAAPVAGITDLLDHVVEPWLGRYDNGVIEGHCDCMYFVHTDRWDYNMLAALVAPRYLLIENTDADPIFPEDGVRRISNTLQRVYGWYDAGDKLDLLIGSGGHVDSPELRHAAFAFFERTLKGKPVDQITIDEPDRSIPKAELRVLQPGEILSDSVNATIHETFVPAAAAPEVPASAKQWEETRAAWLDLVKTEVFGGWPSKAEQPPIYVPVPTRDTVDGIELTRWLLTLQPGIQAPNWSFRPEEPKAIKRMLVHVADQQDWEKRWKPLAAAFDNGGEAAVRDNADWQAIKQEVDNGTIVAMIAPRGVGPTAWPADKDTHIRRRFGLLGQTVDGMRAWDVKRLLDAKRPSDGSSDQELILSGPRDAGVWALWAAVFAADVDEVRMIDPPTTVHNGPALLNLERILDMPQAIALMAPRQVVVKTNQPAAFQWDQKLAETLGKNWIKVEALP